MATTVYGVNPPFSSRSGLTNMELFLFGLVILANEKNASISLPSLHWAGTIPNLPGRSGEKAVQYVPHEALFNVTPWHEAAERGLLPPLTNELPTVEVDEGLLWRLTQARLRALLESGAVRRPVLDEAFAQYALEPSRAVAEAVAAASPPRPYAALHARVELDAAASRPHVAAGYVGFGKLAGILRAHGGQSYGPAIASPADMAGLFVAAAVDNVAPGDAALLRRGKDPVWPGVPLSFGGGAAARRRGFKAGLTDYVAGAVVDKRVCLAADAFIGADFSTFANSIVFGRLVRGLPPESNFVYRGGGGIHGNHQGSVRPRRDDGRIDGVMMVLEPELHHYRAKNMHYNPSSAQAAAAARLAADAESAAAADAVVAAMRSGANVGHTAAKAAAATDAKEGAAVAKEAKAKGTAKEAAAVAAAVAAAADPSATEAEAPATQKRFLQVFNVFHHKLPPSVERYPAGAVTLFAVGEHGPQPKEVGPHGAHLPLVREWELPRHDPFFQELGYHESSAILHVGANGLHRPFEFVGFSQYDHLLALPSEGDLPPNAAVLYVTVPDAPLTEEPAFPRSFVEEHYRKHFGAALDVAATLAKMDGRLIVYNAWIIPSATFERLFPWWLAIAYDLAPRLKQEPQPRRWRHHRHIAGVMERIIGLSIAREDDLEFFAIDNGIQLDEDIRNEVHGLSDDNDDENEEEEDDEEAEEEDGDDGGSGGSSSRGSRVIAGEIAETDRKIVERNLARPLASRLTATRQPPTTKNKTAKKNKKKKNKKDRDAGEL